MKRAITSLLFLTLLAASPGEPAPQLSGPALQGAPVSLERLRGRVVVVDFWASWCEPCRRAFPSLSALQSRYRDRGLTVVGVSVDEDRASAQRFVSELRPNFSIVHDTTHQIAERWSPPSMPTTYVVGRDGRLLVELSGADTQHLEARVQDALGR